MCVCLRLFEPLTHNPNPNPNLNLILSFSLESLRDEAVIAAQLVGVNRSSVYITTKVTAGCGTSISDCSDNPLVALESVKQSLENLNTT